MNNKFSERPTELLDKQDIGLLYVVEMKLDDFKAFTELPDLFGVLQSRDVKLLNVELYAYLPPQVQLVVLIQVDKPCLDAERFDFGLYLCQCLRKSHHDLFPLNDAQGLCLCAALLLGYLY
jgi:hypothetical protein